MRAFPLIVAMALGLVTAGGAGAASASTQWATEDTAGIGGGSGAFFSVSCPADGECVAVGQHGRSPSARQSALAELWNGSVWVRQAMPSPPDASSVFLTGLSCASVTSCLAAGYYETAKGTLTLAEYWNGGTWVIQPTHNPDSAEHTDSFSGISCPAAGSCTAVGHYDHNHLSVPLAEHWNGSAWAMQETPIIANQQDSALYGVSCQTTADCVAVGHVDSTHNSGPLVESWNGTSWSVQTANPAPADGILTAVSCSSATSCSAVGQEGNKTLAEAWNGTAWAVRPTPPVPGVLASLAAVSCASATDCTAAGTYEADSEVNLTLAEHWNGHGWAVQRTVNPSGAQNVLSGVSCTPSGNCTAVGYDEPATSFHPLAEHN